MQARPRRRVLRQLRADVRALGGDAHVVVRRTEKETEHRPLADTCDVVGTQDTAVLFGAALLIGVPSPHLCTVRGHLPQVVHRSVGHPHGM